MRPVFIQFFAVRNRKKCNDIKQKKMKLLRKRCRSSKAKFCSSKYARLRLSNGKNVVIELSLMTLGKQNDKMRKRGKNRKYFVYRRQFFLKS